MRDDADLAAAGTNGRFTGSRAVWLGADEGAVLSGTMQDLGVLPGGIISMASAINDAGQVVGVSETGREYKMHAFLWTAAGGMKDLGTLPGGPGSNANDINAAGQVVGSVTTEQRTAHAVLWTAAGGIRDLGTLPGFGGERGPWPQRCRPSGGRGL